MSKCSPSMWRQVLQGSLAGTLPTLRPKPPLPRHFLKTPRLAPWLPSLCTHTGAPCILETIRAYHQSTHGETESAGK